MVESVHQHTVAGFVCGFRQRQHTRTGKQKACIHQTKQINIFRALSHLAVGLRMHLPIASTIGCVCVNIEHCCTDIKVALQANKTKTTAWRPGAQLSESAFEFKRAFDFIWWRRLDYNCNNSIAYRITHCRFDG